MLCAGSVPTLCRFLKARALRADGERGVGRSPSRAHRSGDDVERTPLAHAEQCLVELAQERRPVAVLERLDERAPSGIGHGRAAGVSVGEPDQLAVQRRARSRAPSRAAPWRAAARSDRATRSKPARSCSERNGSPWNRESSQRSSASASTLSASASPSRTRNSPASAPRNESKRVVSPEAASPRSAARADPIGPAVESLEQDGARGERRGGSQADRADGVGDLGRRVRRILAPVSAARSSSTQ